VNQEPFSPNFSKTKTISASSTSSSVTLDATDVSSTPTNPSAGVWGGHTIMRIVNVGPNTAFIRFGVGAQTAVTTDMPIPSGAIEVFTKAGDADTVAAICAAAQTATVYVTCGQGQ
jgi:hypothetical protein